MPAVPPYIIEPVWQQFCALLPNTNVEHPLGCHRPRIPDRVVFEKLVQELVFGCAYWRIADEECSATTLRRRRDEWIEAGAMDALERIVKAYFTTSWWTLTPLKPLTFRRVSTLCRLLRRQVLLGAAQGREGKEKADKKDRRADHPVHQCHLLRLLDRHAADEGTQRYSRPRQHRDHALHPTQ